jgi:hypothetical protein
LRDFNVPPIPPKVQLEAAPQLPPKVGLEITDHVADEHGEYSEGMFISMALKAAVSVN